MNRGNDSDEEESEVKVNAHAPLNEEQQRFVNAGYFRWARLRSQWTQAIHSTAAKSPSSHSQSQPSLHSELSSSSSTSALGRQINTSSSSLAAHSHSHSLLHSHLQPPASEVDDAADLDLPDIMQCLKSYRAFKEPIRLSTMVDIVQVLWEDEAEG